MIVKTLLKIVDESRPYDFDFTNQVEIVAGETLTGTPVVTAVPTGLTLGAPLIGGANKKVQVRISAGAANTAYEMKCIVATSGSNILVGCGRLLVKEC